MAFKDVLFDEFAALKTVWDQWGSSRNFWHTACTLDACLDFVVAARTAWGAADPQVQTSITSVYQMVNGAKSTFLTNYLADKKSDFKDGNWWDDYGWWGIAFLKVYGNFSIFGGAAAGRADDDCYDSNSPLSQSCCLQLAHDSWTVMHDHAWDTGQYGQTLPVPGGCWNHTPPPGSEGVQNTVTNNLYLRLSINLYTYTKGMAGWEDRNTAYLNAACDQFKWFGDWFLKGPSAGNGNVGIFDQIYDSGAPGEEYRYWILERPVDHSEYNKQGAPAYAKQQWTGDQGVFLGGLIGLSVAERAHHEVGQNPSIVAFSKELRQHNVDPDPIKYIDSLVTRITLASIHRSFTAPPCVLHETPLSADIISNYYADMATGKGVLMRYLALARSYTPDVDVNRLIDTARAICTNPAAEANGFGFIWDNRTGENITLAGTNEDQFLPIVKSKRLGNDNGWNFTIHTIRLDGLAAAIPLHDRVNI